MITQAMSPFGWTVLYGLGKAFFLMSFFSLVMGVILIVAPSRLQEWNRRFNNSQYTFRRATKPLEILRDADPFIERNKKFLGIVFMVASAYLTIFFAFYLDSKAFSAVFSVTSFGLFFTEIFVETFRIFFILAGIFAFIVCTTFTFMPDIFHKMSESFGKWVSTRKAMMPLQKMLFAEGAVIFYYHRIFGALLVCCSVFIIYSLYGLEHY